MGLSAWGWTPPVIYHSHTTNKSDITLCYIYGFVTLGKVGDITSNIVYWYHDSWVLRQTSHRDVFSIIVLKEHNIQNVIIHIIYKG